MKFTVSTIHIDMIVKVLKYKTWWILLWIWSYIVLLFKIYFSVLITQRKQLQTMTLEKFYSFDESLLERLWCVWLQAILSNYNYNFNFKHLNSTFKHVSFDIQTSKFLFSNIQISTSISKICKLKVISILMIIN